MHWKLKNIIGTIIGLGIAIMLLSAVRADDIGSQEQSASLQVYVFNPPTVVVTLLNATNPSDSPPLWPELNATNLTSQQIDVNRTSTDPRVYYVFLNFTVDSEANISHIGTIMVYLWNRNLTNIPETVGNMTTPNLQHTVYVLKNNNTSADNNVDGVPDGRVWWYTTTQDLNGVTDNNINNAELTGSIFPYNVSSTTDYAFTRREWGQLPSASIPVVNITGWDSPSLPPNRVSPYNLYMWIPVVLGPMVRNGSVEDWEISVDFYYGADDEYPFSNAQLAKIRTGSTEQGSPAYFGVYKYTEIYITATNNTNSISPTLSGKGYPGQPNVWVNATGLTGGHTIYWYANNVSRVSVTSDDLNAVYNFPNTKLKFYNKSSTPGFVYLLPAGTYSYIAMFQNDDWNVTAVPAWGNYSGVPPSPYPWFYDKLFTYDILWQVDIPVDVSAGTYTWTLTYRVEIK
mgnify:CR=1 FL=1